LRGSQLERHRNDIEAPRYTTGPREDVNTAGERFPGLPRGALVGAESGGGSATAGPQNPEFTRIELEYEFVEVAGGVEKGGIECRLVLGMTLGLARANPQSLTLLDSIHPILLRHPTHLLAYCVATVMTGPPPTYRDAVVES